MCILFRYLGCVLYKKKGVDNFCESNLNMFFPFDQLCKSWKLISTRLVTDMFPLTWKKSLNCIMCPETTEERQLLGQRLGHNSNRSLIRSRKKNSDEENVMTQRSKIEVLAYFNRVCIFNKFLGEERVLHKYLDCLTRIWLKCPTKGRKWKWGMSRFTLKLEKQNDC